MYSIFSQSSAQSQGCLSQLAAITNGLRSVLQVNNSRRLKSARNSSELKNQVPVNITEDVFKLLLLDCLPNDITIEPATKWNESFVSSPTFFQNKTGFAETSLHNTGICIHGLPAIHLMKNKPLQQLCSPLINQTRGFRTRSHETEVKLESKESDSKTSLGNIFDMNNPIFPSKKKETAELKKEIESNKTSKSTVEIIDEAYSAGYLKGSKNNNKSFSVLKLLVGVLIAYPLFKLFISKDIKNMIGVNEFIVQPEEVKTRFLDVKGSDEAKEELEQIVDYLTDPEKYTRLGAKLPKGVLLVGPPGVGKTLLARAVAGEAGVPFLQAHGSEFEDLFVGSGARKVRNLFRQAKELAPCVIFLDEIDSVGRKRTSDSHQPFANQMVNQLLSEMDGFTENKGIIVIGATNKLENLDAGVTRAGRFDITVHINKPDFKGRKEILGYYLSKVKTDNSLDIKSLASLTIGFSGADISNLVNQAALQATVEGSQAIQKSHIDFAYDKISMGPAKKSKIPSREVNLQTAYHEAGHVLVSYFTEKANKVYKVTILPRGSSLGHTRHLPKEDEYGLSKAQLLAQIDVLMGGQVAEETIYGAQNVSTGASSDIEMATLLATNMVTKFGLNDKLGPRNIDMSTASPQMQDAVDKEIEIVLKTAYQRAKKILESHSNELEVLAQSLMKYETLNKTEIDALLKGGKKWIP